MSDSTPAFLIFGAYGGIGSALSRSLAASGASLAVSGRDPDRVSELADELDAVGVPADASDFTEVHDAVEEAVDSLGRLDGVASCVGSLLLKPAHLTSEEEWMDTLHTNLTSSFAILRAAIKPMRSEGGSIVFTSTAAASIGLPNHEAIAAAKGGIDALVRGAAATYGSKGIRVNAVAPGLVETPMTERITESESARESSEAMHALGRLGAPDDVAEAMQWLLTDAHWVTGQVLGVDGGLGSVRSA